MNGNTAPVIILLLVASVGLTGLLYTSTQTATQQPVFYFTGYAVDCDSVYDNEREKCEDGPKYMEEYCETQAKYNYDACSQEESGRQWRVSEYCEWQEKLALAECDLADEKAKMEKRECEDRAEEAEEACKESDGEDCDEIKDQMRDKCKMDSEAAEQQLEACEDNAEQVRRQCEDKPPFYKCEDSDGGKDYETKGYAEDNEGRNDDYCTGQSFWGQYMRPIYKQLSEAFCDGSTSSSDIVDCENGCRNGACIAAPVCQEISGGARQVAGPNLGEEIYDVCLENGNEVTSCTGPCQLKEGNCENNLITTKTVDCPHGCANGKCVEAAKKCESCQQDSDCQQDMVCKYGDCLPSSYSKTPIIATRGNDGYFEFDPPQNIGHVFIRCKGLYGKLDWDVVSGFKLVQSGGSCQRIDQINSYFITNLGSNVTRIRYDPNQLVLEWPTLYTDAECP